MRPKSSKHFKITLVGAGNVATQLGLALIKSDHQIVQVYSKRKQSASQLGKLLNCDFTASVKDIKTNSDIYIIAIKDDAIEDLSKTLRLSDKIVTHTSGSISMEALLPISKKYGVFYPLQTFSKNKTADFKNIPICLEASDIDTLKTLNELAKSISNNVQTINSEQRKTIHLAAVFASNFSNHLYTIASGILERKNLSLDILKPLIEETAFKIKNNPPAQMQTGPAIRGDKKIMDRQLKLLSGNKKLQILYKLMSQSIIDLSNKNKL